MFRTSLLSTLTTAWVAASAVAAPVTFDWAQVGNAGNIGELSPGGAGGFAPDVIVGAVSYHYAISKTEVANAQYTAFLNAVAATDNFGGGDPTLYRSDMSSDARRGIARSGEPGVHAYATMADMADKPVNYVSFFDAMRFINWLHNGEGSGNTETSAYTIGNGLNEVSSLEPSSRSPAKTSGTRRPTTTPPPAQRGFTSMTRPALI
jgi:hypothetical protein